MSVVDRSFLGQGGIGLSWRALDSVLPMHVVVSPTGHIAQAGPTIQKFCPDDELVGERFLEAFELRRPRATALIKDLVAPSGMKLSLALRKTPGIRLKGLALPLAHDAL